MAGLFLVHDRDPGIADAAMAAARGQFVRHGFGAPAELAVPGWRVLHAPPILGGPEASFADGEDFVAVAGTPVCDGRIGRPALQAMLRDLPLPRPDRDRLGGQFVALVRRGGRIFLLGDYFAAFQLFHDAGMRLFSTSLLAAANALPRLSFDRQGVYEFAFNVVPVGDDTVFAELKTLGPDRVVELTETGTVPHQVDKPLPAAMDGLPLAQRIEAHRARLDAAVGPYLERFGDNVRCPLSGGLDSRLLLALLRARGCRPNVYVYGPPDSADVRVSREVGATLGFEVDWMDKEAWRTVEPDAFAEQVERNFEQYDGLPNFGELFENGGNAAARDARHAGGALAASGGCGEIYRNFFFLPDRAFSAETVARTFFARYASGDLTAAFDEQAFLGRLAGKIAAAVGVPDPRARLPRPLVEQVYPRLRCRALFGREISLEARYGAYLMPFLDHRVVAEALKLPLRLKNAGSFEAALLAAIDPELARLPSAYGHDFARPPGLRHRFGEWATRIRPIRLRQKSYALQRRLGPVADEHGGLLSPDYLGRVIDLDYPAMRRFFQVDRIGDSGMIRRLANLEYLAARLGSRLDG